MIPRELKLEIESSLTVIERRESRCNSKMIENENLLLTEEVAKLKNLILLKESKNLESEFRKRIISALRGLTESVTNQILSPACYLLADFGAYEAIPDFLSLLEPDAGKIRRINFWADPFGVYEESIQEIGCNSLARIKATEAIPEIEKLLLSKNENIRKCAVVTLSSLRS